MGSGSSAKSKYELDEAPLSLAKEDGALPKLSVRFEDEETFSDTRGLHSEVGIQPQQISELGTQPTEIGAQPRRQSVKTGEEYGTLYRRSQRGPRYGHIEPFIDEGSPKTAKPSPWSPTDSRSTSPGSPKTAKPTPWSPTNSQPASPRSPKKAKPPPWFVEWSPTNSQPAFVQSGRQYQKEVLARIEIKKQLSTVGALVISPTNAGAAVKSPTFENGQT